MNSEGTAALDQLFPIIQNDALPKETLQRLQRQTYWRFYSKPRIAADFALKMTNYRNAAKLARAIAARTRKRETASVN